MIMGEVILHIVNTLITHTQYPVTTKHDTQYPVTTKHDAALPTVAIVSIGVSVIIAITARAGIGPVDNTWSRHNINRETPPASVSSSHTIT